MISVIIPSYNRRQSVLDLVADLTQQQGVEFEIIVVDDCSDDDTVAAVRQAFPQVKVLVNETNGGPCVTRNRGVRAAHGELIVGFDSDVTVPDRLLLAKVQAAFAESPAVSGFAFRIFRPDGHTDDAPRWWHPVALAKGKDRRFETDYFSGTAYALRRSMMLAAGLYPEILYMHYEEVELALRIMDHGGSIIYRPDLQVVHHARPSARRSEIQVYYKPRNQVLLTLSCFPLWHGMAYLLPRMFFQLVKALQGHHLNAFGRAMRDAWTKRQWVMNTRQPLKRECFRRIGRLRHS